MEKGLGLVGGGSGRSTHLQVVQQGVQMHKIVGPTEIQVMVAVEMLEPGMSMHQRPLQSRLCESYIDKGVGRRLWLFAVEAGPRWIISLLSARLLALQDLRLRD